MITARVVQKEHVVEKKKENDQEREDHIGEGDEGRMEDVREKEGEN